MTFCVLFVITVIFYLDIDQMVVKMTFLHSQINQLVYIYITNGCEIEANQNIICKLLKVSYSLKQSPRLWYKRHSIFSLQKLSLSKMNTDHSIFMTKAGLNSLVISMFSDNIKIIALKKSGITQRVKAKLSAAFLMIDMSPISFYLGLKVERD